MTTESHRRPPREDTFSVSRRALLSTAAIGTAGSLASVTLPVMADAHSGLLSFSDSRKLHGLLRKGNQQAGSWDENALNEAFLTMWRSLPNSSEGWEASVKIAT